MYVYIYIYIYILKATTTNSRFAPGHGDMSFLWLSTWTSRNAQNAKCRRESEIRGFRECTI